jgi:hypothetical protein
MHSCCKIAITLIDPGQPGADVVGVIAWFQHYDSQRCDGLLADKNANENESSQGTAQIAEGLPITGLF